MVGAAPEDRQCLDALIGRHALGLGGELQGARWGLHRTVADLIAVDAMVALETDQQRAVLQCAVFQHCRFRILLDLALERAAVGAEQRAEPGVRQAARPAAVVVEIGAEPAADIGYGKHALACRVHDQRRPAAEVIRRGGQNHAAAKFERPEPLDLRPVALEMRDRPGIDLDALDARGRRRVLVLGTGPRCGSQHGARPGQQPAQHCPAVGMGQPARVNHDGSRSLPARRGTHLRHRRT